MSSKHSRIFRRIKKCSFFTEDLKVTDINLAQVLPRLRAILRIIGEDILGFKDMDIGLHSLRSDTVFLSRTEDQLTH